MAGRSKWIIHPHITQSSKYANAIARRYIRSYMDLDDLERRARFPVVDANGYESKAVSHVRNG